MSEPITAQHKPERATLEVTPVATLKVSCSGPEFSRHPKVWLTMVDDAKGRPVQVVCPYCSHVFKYDAKLAASAPNSH
jgi:uncharacterized Zn-finger protein